MLIIIFTFLICYIGTSETIDWSSESEVPHAAELRRMITKNLFQQPSLVDGEEIINYIKGNETQTTFIDHFKILNITRLDAAAITRIGAFAKKMLQARPIFTNTRRWDFLYNEFELDHHHPRTTAIIIDMMYQTLHDTRVELRKTKRVRKAYKDNKLYYLGHLFGELQYMKLKMDNLDATLDYFTSQTYWLGFHYYVVLYSKFTKMSVDIDFVVKNMFKLADEAKKQIAEAQGKLKRPRKGKGQGKDKQG